MSSLPLEHRGAARAFPIAVLWWLAPLAAQDWQPMHPFARSYAAMVYDSVRDRTVLFGGRTQLNSPYAAATRGSEGTWEFDGESWHRAATAGPSERRWHAMVYDRGRARVVLFGGTPLTQLVNLGDTWEFDGAAWQQIVTPSAPSPRSGHALAYDSRRGKVVMFGGSNSETWEYSATGWAFATASGPSARSGHVMQYDPASSVTVMHAGIDVISTLLADTWQWNGTSWTSIATPTAPPPRTGATAAYDLARSRIVMRGGEGAAGSISDTWEFYNNNWHSVATPTAPPILRGQAIAYDELRHQCYLFGGETTLGVKPDASLWTFDGVNWAPHATASMPPAARSAMAYDAGRGQTVMFGGLDASNETWLLVGSHWERRVTNPAPSARQMHAMAFDTRRNRTVLFGGSDVNFTPLADTWEWDGAAWTQIVTPQSPSARGGHCLAYDAARGRTVLFGGANLADTWEYDGANWVQRTPAQSPPTRAYATMVYDSARLRTVLTGGLTDAPTTIASDTWEWDGVAWTAFAGATAPSNHYQDAIVFDPVRGRALLAVEDQFFTPATWEYDGLSWQPHAAPVTPATPQGSVGAFDVARSRAVLFVPIAGATWIYVPPLQPTAARHGKGCPGQGNQPSLDAGGLPMIGTTMALRIAGLPTQPGAALLAFGFDIAQSSGAALPLSLAPFGWSGCDIWIDPSLGITAPVVHAGSSTNYPLVVPNVLALADVVVGVQALVLDSAAVGSFGGITNALVLRLR